MAENRMHQRINCAEKCLFYYADAKFSGAIMNISISGALIKLNGCAPGTISPGDTCNLLLTNAQETSFCTYRGRIARVHPAGIGVEILEHEF